MIDGLIDLVGTKKEAEAWLEKFIEEFKGKKPIKGMVYRSYIGVELIPESELANSAKGNKTAKVLDAIDGLKEDIESEEPVGMLKTKSLRVKEGYA